MSFDPTNHTLQIDEQFVSEQILIPAAEHFLSTEKYPIDSLPMFQGVGVYAIYVDQEADTIYNGVIGSDYPIYVGKAVPSGARQGK